MSRVQNPLPQLVAQRVSQLKAQVDAQLWERVQPLDVFGGPVNPEPIAFAAGRWQRLQRVRQ